MSDSSNDNKIIQMYSGGAFLTLLGFMLPRPDHEVLRGVWAGCGVSALMLGSIAAGTGIWAAVRRPRVSVVCSAAVAVLLAIAAWWRLAMPAPL